MTPEKQWLQEDGKCTCKTPEEIKRCKYLREVNYAFCAYLSMADCVTCIKEKETENIIQQGG
jgi:hypothetical protein